MGRVHETSDEIELKAARRARAQPGGAGANASGGPETCPTCGTRLNQDMDQLRRELTERILKLRRARDCSEPTRCQHGACRRAKTCTNATERARR